VPFVLLLISGMALLLGSSPEDAVRTVTGLLMAFLPNNTPSAIDLLNGMVNDVLRTRGAVTVYAAVGFAWFSTRLFGSLRSVLAQIFDGTDRGIVVGKLFDFLATLVATMALAVYVAISTYLDMATTRGVALLARIGLRESAMGTLTYMTGRLIAISIVFTLFYAMYHGLPRRRPSVRTALTAAAAASLMFEIARHVFSLLVRQFDPSSLYTGTIAVIVAVVFWTYYGALIFLVGGETAQAVELRRAETVLLERNVPAPALGRTPAGKTSVGKTPASKPTNGRTPTPTPPRKKS
jgi:membrane protein